MENDNLKLDITGILARILKERAEKLGFSLRDIQDASGVPHSTVGRIFRGDSTIGIDKFTDVAHALGLRAWKVMAQAEKELAESPVSPTTPSTLPLSEEYITQLEQDLASGKYAYAAYTAPPMPDADTDSVGEESQIPDGWDE